MPFGRMPFGRMPFGRMTFGRMGEQMGRLRYGRMIYNDIFTGTVGALPATLMLRGANLVSTKPFYFVTDDLEKS
jgi:hypothetical protein